MKLGSSRGTDTRRPRGSERSKPRHKLRLTRPSQRPYPGPPEQAQPGVSEPCRTTVGEERSQAGGGADRGADIDRRTRLAGRDIAPAILEVGLVARVRPQDLIALPAARAGRRDRAGADDLSLRHRLVEARERRLLGAAEAKAPVALRIGAAGAPARAGVDPAATLRRGDLLGRAEGADHVLVVSARGVDGADV